MSCGIFSSYSVCISCINDERFLTSTVHSIPGKYLVTDDIYCAEQFMSVSCNSHRLADWPYAQLAQMRDGPGRFGLKMGRFFQEIFNARKIRNFFIIIQSLQNL